MIIFCMKDTLELLIVVQNNSNSNNIAHRAAADIVKPRVDMPCAKSYQRNGHLFLPRMSYIQNDQRKGRVFRPLVREIRYPNCFICALTA